MNAWIESLGSDSVLGLRRLRKNKITSAAAILSLALAIGACTSAFRLIDAVLLHPLPIAHADRLYSLTRNIDGWEYGEFTRLRDAVTQQATLLALSFSERVDLTYGSDDAMEKGHVQYVSGSMFSTFGLLPASGRLLTERDDVPVAVLSDDYWSRRFGRDPHVVGHTFRLADRIYEIVGVASPGFTGTEPGTVIDIFLPAAMHWGVGHEWAVFRAFAQLQPNLAAGPVQDRLNASLHALNRERRRKDQILTMTPAAAGASGLQKNYRLALSALSVLVALVLLIACANVANLMTAQGAARAREMAVRISIGASRWRLMQLVLVESAWIAILASIGGALFAWWAAPFVVRMISIPEDPARLFLSADWRVLGFGIVLTVGVTILFGIGPALRASIAAPARRASLRRRGWMRALIAIQAAFCFLVLFVAGLFVMTFERLSHQATGISPERILTLDTVSRKDQPLSFWSQTAEYLRRLPGVEKVAIAEWPILDGWGYRSSSISVDGGPPREGGWFLYISAGLLDTMKMPLRQGRDFRDADANVAIVNQAFARQYFNGENPVGRWFSGSPTNLPARRFQIVGLVRDARYRYLREGFLPVAYVPFHGGDRGTFIVRTQTADPLTMASTLRQEIPKARPEFRVSNIRTQQELIASQTLRERLLAMLAMFFAAVALVLAGVGLYGVLNYSVVERRKEIGIRLAIGASGRRIARLVTLDIFAMVTTGALAGLAMGMGSVRFIESLFFQVKASDTGMLIFPAAMLVIAALLAALPAVIHAVRIDPVEALRAE